MSSAFSIDGISQSPIPPYTGNVYTGFNSNNVFGPGSFYVTTDYKTTQVCVIQQTLTSGNSFSGNVVITPPYGYSGYSLKCYAIRAGNNGANNSGGEGGNMATSDSIKFVGPNSFAFQIGGPTGNQNTYLNDFSGNNLSGNIVYCDSTTTTPGSFMDGLGNTYYYGGVGGSIGNHGTGKNGSAQGGTPAFPGSNGQDILIMNGGNGYNGGAGANGGNGIGGGQGGNGGNGGDGFSAGVFPIPTGGNGGNGGQGGAGGAGGPGAGGGGGGYGGNGGQGGKGVTNNGSNGSAGAVGPGGMGGICGGGGGAGSPNGRGGFGLLVIEITSFSFPSPFLRPIFTIDGIFSQSAFPPYDYTDGDVYIGFIDPSPTGSYYVTTSPDYKTQVCVIQQNVFGLEKSFSGNVTITPPPYDYEYSLKCYAIRAGNNGDGNSGYGNSGGGYGGNMTTGSTNFTKTTSFSFQIGGSTDGNPNTYLGNIVNCDSTTTTPGSFMDALNHIYCYGGVGGSIGKPGTGINGSALGGTTGNQGNQGNQAVPGDQTNHPGGSGYNGGPGANGGNGKGGGQGGNGGTGGTGANSATGDPPGNGGSGGQGGIGGVGGPGGGGGGGGVGGPGGQGGSNVSLTYASNGSAGGPGPGANGGICGGGGGSGRPTNGIGGPGLLVLELTYTLPKVSSSASAIVTMMSGGKSVSMSGTSTGNGSTTVESQIATMTTMMSDMTQLIKSSITGSAVTINLSMIVDPTNPTNPTNQN